MDTPTHQATKTPRPDQYAARALIHLNVPLSDVDYDALSTPSLVEAAMAYVPESLRDWVADVDFLPPVEVEIDMEAVAAGVRAAGYAAYVETTGGGVATIFASRRGRDDYPDRPQANDDEHYDAIAGPGHFRAPGFAMPYSDAELWIGRDDDGDGPTVTAYTVDAAVAALVAILRFAQ
jgi:hypothetical protein